MGLGTWVFVTTEVLSFFGVLTSFSVWCLWLALLAGLVALSWSQWTGLRDLATVALARMRPPWDRSVPTSVGICAAILLVTLVAGLASVPADWDVVSYHLPRVMQWAQNRSVAFYPTQNSLQLGQTPGSWQLWQPPGAEYGFLHLFLLAQADRFLSIQQWAAFGVVLIAVSWIAKRLGVSTPGQSFAAVFVATLPVALLQASSAKNTLVLAMWLSVAVALLLEIRKPASPLEPRWAALLSGCALALAALTHGLGYLVGLPIGVWWLVRTILALRNGALTPILVAATVGLLINLPHWSRNLQEYDHPLGPATDHYRNASVTPATLVSNAVRNLALHLSSPWRDWNDRVISAVTVAHNWVGLNADDPATTWNRQFFLIYKPLRGLTVPAPWHVVVVFTSAGLLLFGGRRFGTPRNAVFALALCLLAAVSLFCLVLKWQIWHLRLHLVFFVLASPIVAVAWGQVLTRRQIAVGSVIFGLAATPWLFWSTTRSLLGERNIWNTPDEQAYFSAAPRFGERMLAAIGAAGEVPWDHLGLVVDRFEYPIWRLLVLPREARVTNVTIAPAGSTDGPVAPAAPVESGAPQCVLAVPMPPTGSIIAVSEHGQRYHEVWRNEEAAIFCARDLLEVKD
ncbi:MAG: hypothetical protein GY788_06325 [bacterium]|nr:hypothetical protein [bacterium]